MLDLRDIRLEMVVVIVVVVLIVVVIVVAFAGIVVTQSLAETRVNMFIV